MQILLETLIIFAFILSHTLSVGILQFTVLGNILGQTMAALMN